MRLVHRSARGDRIVDVEIDDPHRTVGELLDVMGIPSLAHASGGISIDAIGVTADLPLSAVALFEGSVVERTTDAGATPTPARVLTVSGGIRAGGAVAAAGPVAVGRDTTNDLQLADPAVSRRHLRVGDGTLEDLGSRNGTSVEGQAVAGPTRVADGSSIRLGATRLCLRVPVDDRPAAVVAGHGAGGGLVPFNRPPRSEPPTVSPMVVVPATVAPPPASEPLSIAGIVLPVIAGGVVAVLFSPFMAVCGPRAGAHRRHLVGALRLSGPAGPSARLERLHDDLDRLRVDLPSLRRGEIARRRILHPDLWEVIRRGAGPSVRCWERRADHGDAFRVAIGTADLAFAPSLTTGVAVGRAGRPGAGRGRPRGRAAC
ncbi:MAG: FHA domain-containing protein [Acidimicrobiales bacterium]